MLTVGSLYPPNLTYTYLLSKQVPSQIGNMGIQMVMISLVFYFFKWVGGYDGDLI